MDDRHVQSSSIFFIKLNKELDLPQSKVAEMERNYHSPSRRKDAYLDLYVTSHPCPSWRQVAQALRDVDLHHQADVVESTYVQGTRINRYVIVHYCTLYGGMGNGGAYYTTALLILGACVRAMVVCLCVGLSVCYHASCFIARL